MSVGVAAGAGGGRRPAWSVDRAAADGAQEIAGVLADAFDGYAWTSWIVPEDRRRQRLRELFALTVSEVGLPFGDVWIARAAPDRVVGAVVALRPRDPHVTVATVGVVPVFQRMGVATALLQPVLALVDRLAVPAYLETSSPENLKLYERLEFVVAGRVDIDDGPTVWALRRMPAEGSL